METGSKLPEQARTQHYHVLQELGDCYASISDFVQARQYYEQAATYGPDEPGPYIGLGVIALQNGLLDDADIAFRVACRLDDKTGKAYTGLAMTAQKKSDWKKAFEMYLKSFEMNSDNLTAIVGLFQTSCQMGSFSKIIHYLEVYLNMHPADTSVMFSLAALYMKDRRLDEAKRLLQDVLTFAPDNKDAEGLLEEVEHNLARNRQTGVTV